MFEKDGAEYRTYGEYLRSKSLRVDTGRDGRRAWDAEIDAYKDARRQGVQPAGTRMHHIKAAMEASDAAGKPYDAGTGGFSE